MLSIAENRPILLSVVVPCFNEEEVIVETHRRISATFEHAEVDFEVIYVDDGSRDRTLDCLRDLAAKDDRVRIVALSRNFGHQLAATAGLDSIQGDVALLIDADLQDPPEVALDMLERWREGYGVVYGQRLERDGESLFKKSTAKLFYRALNRMCEIDLPLDTGDFRLMDRAVVAELSRMPERDRFLRGLSVWLGFKQTGVPYRRAARHAGASKYPLGKMMQLAVDGLLSFSRRPLRVATWLGLFTTMLALSGIVYAVVLRLFTGIWVPGWTLLFVATLFLGSVQLIALGVLGEYIGSIYAEVKRRPLYVVAERIGFDTPGLQAAETSRVQRARQRDAARAPAA